MSAVFFPEGAIAQALGKALLDSLWQGTLLALCVLLVQLVTPSPRTRHAMSGAALIAAVILFSATFWQYLWRVPGVAAASTLERMFRLPALTPGDFWTGWLGMGWLFGACLFCLRQIAGASLLRNWRKQALEVPEAWREAIFRWSKEVHLRRRVGLFASTCVDSPAVFGHWKPVILVPIGFFGGLPVDAVEAILLHELAHVLRSDSLANTCQRIVEGLFFYHPAVWWISAVIRSEREKCCDDLVVSWRGDRHGYAAALVSLEQHRFRGRRNMAAYGLNSGGGNLKQRVQRLLLRQGEGRFRLALAVPVCLMLSAMAFSVLPTHVRRHASAATLRPDTVWTTNRLASGANEHVTEAERTRRTAVADRRFGGRQPGHRTARGRIYVRYGPPDVVASHSGTGSGLPREMWIYTKENGKDEAAVKIFRFAVRKDGGDYELASDK